jgi:hypothetical protein
VTAPSAATPKTRCDTFMRPSDHYVAIPNMIPESNRASRRNGHTQFLCRKEFQGFLRR